MFHNNQAISWHLSKSIFDPAEKGYQSQVLTISQSAIMITSSYQLERVITGMTYTRNLQ